ncbi:hypothetical protein JET14_13550 [Martelella lutilitoris]|uniref:Integrase n=1 Tax=Martelella lutilitoris TaxID=2583532 RepID=A0A7T7HHM3_9HYPH|nr:hypothetical protein [Martelella lutilitoris]QQM29349.1 hypothetical protein JET14_13550 [Martelella lutilitoris]
MRTDRPGYQGRKRKDGSVVHYWNPQRAVKGAPKALSIVRLDDGLSDEEISTECQKRTAELRNEMQDAGRPPRYDGTIKSLIACYLADPTSSIHSVKYSTRKRDYEPSLRVLEKNIGDRSISSLRASDFRRWFEKWRSKGHRRASGAVKLLRVILSYGAGERLAGCAQAREILSVMRFEQPKARNVAMTYDQCLAIIRASAEVGASSIGFVEALKFETGLRRIDVIGEWIPGDDGQPFRWRGLTAGDISKDLILTVETSKTHVGVVRDLTVLPLVVEALKAYELPKIGPVVINEETGKPYYDNRYTKRFAKVREKAGVPENVWSMDSRAGAVTETVAATGSIERARDLATHTTAKMTERYSRGNGLEEARQIAEARAKLRKGNAV